MKSSVAASGAMAGVLLLVLVVEWLPGGQEAVTVAPPNLHPRAVSEPDTVAKDTESWARTIVARPLFAINRRPPKSAGGRSAVASTGLPRLSGIMISQAGKRAIFMPEGGRARTLAEGAMLDEYRISQISADRVILSGAKGEMVLKPAYDGLRAGGGAEPGVGQPGFPGFQPPGFQPPGFNPAFRPPGFPLQAPQPQPAANASDDDNADDAPPAQPVAPPVFPGFHGPFIPRGRSNE